MYTICRACCRRFGLVTEPRESYSWPVTGWLDSLLKTEGGVPQVIKAKGTQGHSMDFFRGGGALEPSLENFVKLACF